MIRSFADKRTARLFAGTYVRDLHPGLQRRARAKLVQLDHASTLEQLAAVPGHHLEKLAGDRHGQHSMRVNAQWRVCFTWRDGDAFDVWFGDYH